MAPCLRAVSVAALMACGALVARAAVETASVYGEAPDTPRSLMTLSILPFTVNGATAAGETARIGQRMTDELQVPLSESGRFRILTRSEMTLEKMNRLVELQATQGRAEERAAFGRMSCEEAFIAGSVHENRDGGYRVYLDVISLASGEKIMALRMDCWHENAFPRLALAFTREIVSRVDIAGKVAAVDGERVFVAFAGGPDGVRKGDLLDVRPMAAPLVIEGERIDPGLPSVIATLVVEEITASGHARCAPAAGRGPVARAPSPGDTATLVPVLPLRERRPVAVLRPFTVAAESGADGGGVAREIAELVREELLVSDGALHGMRIAELPGTDTFAREDIGDRALCDALGADAVLNARLSVRGRRVRAFFSLVRHPQRSEYARDGEGDADALQALTRVVTVDLPAGEDLAPESAAERVAGEALKAFALPVPAK